MNKLKIEGFLSVKESPQQIILRRKYKGFLWYIIPMLLGGFFCGVLFVSEYFFYASIAFLVFYIGLRGVFNVITITINKEFFQAKHGIFPMIWSDDKFAMKDFDSVFLEKTYSKTGNRKYSQQKGFFDEKTQDGYDFMVYLKDGSRKNILSFGIGAVGADFLKQKIEEFASKIVLEQTS